VGLIALLPPFFMKEGDFMGKIDWDIVTNYTDVVTTTLKTVTFPKVQEQVYLRNQGNANFTYTIGSQSGTLTPGQSVTVNQDVSSFTLQAVSGTHTFEVRAKEKGTEQIETETDVMSQLAESVKHSSANWLNLPTPNYVSHRGVEASAPENTMAAFELSAQQGFPIGMDLYQTIDGVVVCRHDNELSTRSDASGLVTSSLYSSFHNASAGSWLGDSFANEKVPTFEQVLNKYGGKHLIQAEIYGGQGDAVFTKLANLITDRNLEKHVVFEVANTTDMGKLHTVNPNILVCITSGQPANLTTISANAFMVNWSAASITQAGVNAAKAKGLKVQAYGVTTKAQADSLILMGVDYINCSDPIYCKGGITFQTPFNLPVGKDSFGSFWSFTESTAAPTVNGYFIGYTKSSSPSAYHRNFYGYTTKQNDIISFDLKFPDILPSTAYVNLLIVDDSVNWNLSVAASSNKNLTLVQIYANGKIQTYNIISGAMTNIVTDTTAFTAYVNGEVKSFSVKLTSTGITLITPEKTTALTMTPVYGQISLRFSASVLAGFKNVKVENNG
jgi:glycerophosphoryl diester phosphodiesterase